MSTTLKATCPTHGEKPLRPDEVTLFVNKARDEGKYLFACPEDTEPIINPADKRTIRLLMDAAVKVIPIPEVPTNPIPEAVIEAFPHDEFLDGMVLLKENPDQFWEMMQRTDSNLPENS